MAVALVSTQLLLRFLRFVKTRRLLRSLPPTSRQQVVVDEFADRLVRVSHSRPVVALGVDCVAESLVLEAALRRFGLEPALRIGLDPASPNKAHAWVELDGRPLNDKPDVESRWAAFGDEIPLR